VGCLLKHDQYTSELVEQIKHNYDSLSTNVLLKKKKRSLGEIDILAKKGERYDAYEVKCSFRITKAKKQAKGLRKHFGKAIDHIYFYCGATATLILL
jgi:predicted RecB family endonuclease